MILHDNLHIGDDMKQHRSGFFAKTKVTGGFDPYKDRNGITQFGTTVFEQENMIVLGGSLFTLQKLFNQTSDNVPIQVLDSFIGANNNGPIIANDDNTYVCLFGIGTGGAGDSLTDVYEDDYREYQLSGFLPLRWTNDSLDNDGNRLYWFSKNLAIGGVTKKAYYLKKFNTVNVHVLWQDGIDGEDGSPVDNGIYGTTSNVPIESFVEIYFEISKYDTREYFIANNNIEPMRYNTIGLFTGVQSTLLNGSPEYKNVKLFSKLNVKNESLDHNKDLGITYRIYAS